MASIVAAGHRPARQIVFALLLDRHRAGGAFQRQDLARAGPGRAAPALRKARIMRAVLGDGGESLLPAAPIRFRRTAFPRCGNGRGGNRKSPRRWHKGRARAAAGRRAAAHESADKSPARCRHARSAAIAGTAVVLLQIRAMLAAVRAQRALRQIAGLRRPFRMMRRRDCPNPSGSASIAGIEIKPDQAGGIGLFIDQRQRGRDAQKRS